MAGKKVVTLDLGWALLVKDLGLRPDNVLKRARLAGDLFSKESARLTVDEYFRLWNSLEAEAGDRVLPLLIGEMISPEMFHPAVFAAFCSPDLRVAVRRIADYKRLIAPMCVEATETDERFFVGIRWDDPKIEIPAGLAATELVYVTKLARLATREPVRPLRVESPHPLEPGQAYAEFFGVAPVKSQRHGVTFSVADAHRPFLSASDAIWQTFKPELQRRLTKLDRSAAVSERVRSQLLESLPAGETSITIVADRLGVSARTLQRKLNVENLSFQDIVNQTRKDLALHYVADSNFTYAQIAYLIGYEETSSFFRAFRDWTGSTPAGIREKAQDLH